LCDSHPSCLLIPDYQVDWTKRADMSGYDKKLTTEGTELHGEYGIKPGFLTKTPCFSVYSEVFLTVFLVLTAY
jgi:hypothetical protein